MRLPSLELTPPLSPFRINSRFTPPGLFHFFSFSSFEEHGTTIMRRHARHWPVFFLLLSPLPSPSAEFQPSSGPPSSAAASTIRFYFSPSVVTSLASFDCHIVLAGGLPERGSFFLPASDLPSTPSHSTHCNRSSYGNEAGSPPSPP